MRFLGGWYNIVWWASLGWQVCFTFWVVVGVVDCLVGLRRWVSGLCGVGGWLGWFWVSGLWGDDAAPRF